MGGSGFTQQETPEIGNSVGSLLSLYCTLHLFPIFIMIMQSTAHFTDSLSFLTGEAERLASRGFFCLFVTGNVSVLLLRAGVPFIRLTCTYLHMLCRATCEKL